VRPRPPRAGRPTHVVDGPVPSILEKGQVHDHYSHRRLCGSSRDLWPWVAGVHLAEGTSNAGQRDFEERRLRTAAGRCQWGHHRGDEPLCHKVRVTSAGFEMQNGSGQQVVIAWPPNGSSIPGEVQAHDAGMTWMSEDDLSSSGLDIYKPLVGWVDLATGERFRRRRRRCERGESVEPLDGALADLRAMRPQQGA